jgi:hypothetical protein
MRTAGLVTLGISLTFLNLSGCASGPDVKTQAFAELKNERVFESEFPAVWKAIEATMKNHKIVERDPEEVTPLEMKKLKERELTTDWIYTQSRDKYIEYKVNSLPKKKYLQTRMRYQVEAESVMGGTFVKVLIDEEIERLKKDGTPDGYESVSKADSSRAHELLEKIRYALLSAAP